MNIKELTDKIFANKKYLIVTLLCGMLLMMLPTTDNKAEREVQHNEECFSLQEEEKRLKDILSSIQGVGKCEVLLSVHNGTENVFAEHEGEPVILSNGNGEVPITIMKRYPEYQGAVIVIGGYANANARFDILSAVMSYTGLGTDRITICPLEE